MLTWHDYAEKAFSTILSRHKPASTIIYINGPYDLNFSTKDSEHELRSTNFMNSEVSINVYPKSGNKFPMQQEFS